MNSFGLYSDYGSKGVLYWWSAVPRLVKWVIFPFLGLVYMLAGVLILIAGLITIIPELLLWAIERQGRE